MANTLASRPSYPSCTSRIRSRILWEWLLAFSAQNAFSAPSLSCLNRHRNQARNTSLAICPSCQGSCFEKRKGIKSQKNKIEESPAVADLIPSCCHQNAVSRCGSPCRSATQVRSSHHGTLASICACSRTHPVWTAMRF